MTHPDEQIRAFLKELDERRGMPDFFDQFEQARIPSGAVTLHLDVIAVDRTRPTVVFMPGTNAYAMLYGEFLVALAERGCNIVGFDPRGHGRSSGRRGSYTVPELMADFRAAIRYARQRFGEPIVLAGSSQGGIVAFYLAAEGIPAAGAIYHNLADLPGPRSVDLTAMPAMSRMMKPIVTFAARLMPEFPVPMSAYIKLKQEPIRDVGNSLDLLRTGPLLVPYIRLKGLASLGSEPLPCPIEDIRTPVMVLHGERDVIFPQAYVEAIYERLACQKTLKVYEGCHHYILFDHVERVVPDVAAWLESIC